MTDSRYIVSKGDDMKKILTLSLLILTAGCSPLKSITQFETQSNTNRVSLHSYQMSNSTASSIYTHIATISPHLLNGNTLQATGFEQAGSHAFIAYNTEGNVVRGGLDIISINSLNTPSIVSSIVSENSEYAELKIKGNYLFMVGQKKDISRNYGVLTVVDVLNKSNPVAVEELVFTDGWYATSIDIEGNKAYITIPNFGVKEVDISNPLNVQITDTKASSNALFTRRHGNASIVVGGLNSHKVSKIDQNSSSTLLTISNQQQEAPARFALSGNTLFSNGGNTGLTILDQVHSANPVLKSQTTVQGRGNGISAGQCKTLYLAQGEQGLLTYDISNLSAPSFVARFDFSGAQEDCGSANNVFVSKINGIEYVFVADGLAGVKIVKVDHDASSCGCEDASQGLSCKVYDLSATRPTSLPNFSSMTPVGSFTTNQLDVVPQTWQNSFPLFPTALKTYKEWYGIVCEGKWTSTASQTVEFSLGSDDGSKLYIDNSIVINNDGLHSPTTKTATLQTTPKTYNIKVEYYQGPQTQIQLELKTKINNQSSYMTGFWN